jgi:hypothetical protein
MFPFRTSSIFRSRWMALLWAAGIVWMAVDVAGTPNMTGNDAQPTDESGVVIDQAQMEQTQKLLRNIGQ